MASGQGLTLLSGPANAGKVALLLERYLDALERDPLLIVPHGSDVERIERELLRRAGRAPHGRHRHVRRPLRPDRPRRGFGQAGRHRRPAAADRSHRRLRHVAERPRRFVALLRLRRLARSDPRRARVRARRSWRPARRSRAPLRVLSRGAGAARALGPRPRCVGMRRIASPASSTPGRGDRCSPTASRT